ncbi:hypothetical protein HF086_000029 [Spodoptera exigua]|uniref:Uncharacterized protein n=1 Tax=Spodoptera exigua TaxID=7107 RepID=A0A922MZ88_SPOEX|nr:hypothetical protein HF086_000029 [Spodoptera exigua]
MTELELDNLILENNSLHKQIEKLTTENNTLKSLCHSSSIIESTPNPKQKRILTQRNAASTPVPFLQDSELLQISNLEQKVQRLQKQLKDAEQEITDLTQQIISLTQRLHNNSINNDKKTCSMLSNQPTYVSNQLQLYNYPPNITNYPPNPNQMEQPDKTIYILGAQRCVGLAATTISSRLNAKYDKYRIIAETKPNAVTDEIVKSCKHLQLKPGDKLVLSVGENDDNAKKVLSQLNDVLRKFNNNTIIVLSVAKNYYLDIAKLNKSIRNLCTKFQNCNFVKCKFNSLYKICTSINYIVDYSDYNEKYLNPKAIRQLMSNKPSNKPNTSTSEAKKGTIPYYFNHIRNRNRIRNLNEGQSNTNIQTTKNAHKGTIPFYFPVIKRSNAFFRD